MECGTPLRMMTELGLPMVHQQLTDDAFVNEHQVPFLAPHQSILASPSLAHAFHNQTVLSMIHSPQGREGVAIPFANDLVSIAMEPTTSCAWPSSPPPMMYPLSPPTLQGFNF